MHYPESPKVTSDIRTNMFLKEKIRITDDFILPTFGKKTKN